jgi:predicted nucleic acid-binding protein
MKAPLPIAVLDACVLYPAPLRDFLMRLATANLYEPRWSAIIHEEWIRNLLENRSDLKRPTLERTRDLMNAAIPNASVLNDESLIKTLTLPDLNDRHVLATAIQGNASLIVTFNLRDFPAGTLAPYKVTAIHPDAFAVRLYTAYPTDFVNRIRIHRASLISPPKSVEEYLATLRQNQLPEIAERLSKRADEI